MLWSIPDTPPAERCSLEQKLWVGLPPDFLCSLVALAHLMRLSLLKAAHAVVSGAAYRKSGSPRLFRPRYAGANLGHPSGSYRRAVLNGLWLKMDD
jgi:hypothetical protein